MRKVSTLTGLGPLIIAFWAGAGPAMSQDAASAALREADKGTFASADLNGDGKITRREQIHFTDLVFLSIDADGDETLSPEEFLTWDSGYVHAAGTTGQTEAVNQAKEDVFAELDLNEDGTVEHDEMSAATLYYFYRADVDHSRFLDQREFTQKFIVLETLRSALE